ncbi:hypothetical protein [Sphingomonas sp.]|uniref:hypothetical protein n=1 Tax=Sphingomonas sp. TaxID=28214 RepID=UPI001ED3B7D9|nr:hypothetical protein [Sphingomonas sp.]MBX3595180.1 hypothetical protein [Sphingomonas sp.]
MPTHAQLSAKLLRDAATFFRNVAAQNPDIAAQMNDNAAVYDQIAERVEFDPLGELAIDESPSDAADRDD